MRARDLAVLGANIRARREAMGLTSTKLATRAGLDRSYISTVETGTRGSYPKRETLESIARALKTTVEDLEGGAFNVAADLTPYDRNPAYRDLIDNLEDLTAGDRVKFAVLLASLTAALVSDESHRTSVNEHSSIEQNTEPRQGAEAYIPPTVVNGQVPPHGREADGDDRRPTRSTDGDDDEADKRRKKD
jgi:transcriptional regulator with XRE-family HTH domain